MLQTADIPEGKESMQMVTRLHISTLGLRPAGQISAMLFARWDGRRGGGKSPDIRILRDFI